MSTTLLAQSIGRYQLREISIGKAAQEAGVTLEDFISLLKDHGIPINLFSHELQCGFDEMPIYQKTGTIVGCSTPLVIGKKVPVIQKLIRHYFPRIVVHQTTARSAVWDNVEISNIEDDETLLNPVITSALIPEEYSMFYITNKLEVPAMCIDKKIFEIGRSLGNLIISLQVFPLRALHDGIIGKDETIQIYHELWNAGYTPKLDAYQWITTQLQNYP